MRFMVVLDVAIVNVALPSIRTDLHVSRESLRWVITAYSIAYAYSRSGTAPHLLGSRLGDFERELRALLTTAPTAAARIYEQIRDLALVFYRRP